MDVEEGTDVDIRVSMLPSFPVSLGPLKITLKVDQTGQKRLPTVKTNDIELGLFAAEGSMKVHFGQRGTFRLMMEASHPGGSLQEQGMFTLLLNSHAK